MLGTPPAFVLSQDQTLKKLYPNFRRSSNQFFDHLCFWQKLLKNFRWLFLFALIHELLNKSINLSKVFQFVFTLFNLQGTDRFVCCSHYCNRCEPLYYIASIRICQVLFQVFSNSFVRLVVLKLIAIIGQLLHVSTFS